MDGTLFGIQKSTWFQTFKYSVYVLLLINLLLYGQEDYLASQHTFRDGVNWDSFKNAYATTIDTAAWFILLLFFEFETYTVDDIKFRGALKWSVQVASLLCLLLIVLAFTGYFEQFTTVGAFVPASYGDACAAVGHIQSYASDFDQYHTLTAKNCADLNPGAGSSVGVAPFYVHANNSLLASQATLDRMVRLAGTDVINAGAWIMVVIVLEVEIMLQFRHALSRRLILLGRYIKASLYSILFAAALYWGFLSALLDFWDAFLWIIAFFFIELNMFHWSAEIRAETGTDNSSASSSAPLK